MYHQGKNKLRQDFFSANQNILVSFFVVLICLMSNLFFPVSGPAQTITRTFFFLILLPVAYIKIILKRKIADFGWNLKDKKVAFIWTIGIFFFTLLLFYLLLSFTGFKTGYALDESVRNNFWLFLVYELLFVNFSIFVFSFFFQGFVLGLFQEKFGLLSVAFAVLLFLGALFLTDSLSWQTIPFVLLSINGGFLALKTKSFFYSYFMNIFAIIILDSCFIYLTR